MHEMKKIIMVMALAFTVTLCLGISLGCQERWDNVSASDKADLVTRGYDYDYFNGIDFGGAADIIVRKATGWSVNVTMPRKLEPYFKLSVRSGNLVGAFRNVPKSLGRLLGEGSVKVEISMPSLVYVNLSGACSIFTADTFDSGNAAFRVKLEGAVEADLSAAGREVEIDLGGASRLDFKGSRFIDGEIEVSGASDADIVADFMEELEVSASGASHLSYQGTCEDLSLEASGATSVILTGAASEVDMSASGSADVKAKDFMARTAEVEASGASNVRLGVSEYLEAKASGSATVRYYSPDGKIRVNAHESGAGKVKGN